MIDYLLLGDFTRDLLPDGTSMPGGTALYSALAAHRLGVRVGVVSAPAALPAYWPKEIAVASVGGAQLPTFENQYVGGQRSQMLHASASEHSLDAVPATWRNAPIVHFGPVLNEVPEKMVGAFSSAFIGVTPQGWMRTWHTPLPAPIRYAPWQPSAALLQRINALVLSIEDVQGDETRAHEYAAHCPIVALTRGEQGATLFVDGKATAIPAVAATERDPTGAGDVFAAALFCALHAGKPPLEAAHAAAAVAANSVEIHGAAGLLSMPVVW